MALFRLLGRALLSLFHVRSSRASLLGHARFMSFFERRRFLSARHSGFVLSPSHRLSQEASFRNLLLVAPTGAGKSSAFAVPNALLVHGSLVLTDPAGELHRLTSGHLASRGYQIRVLAPADLPRSLRFNPLQRIASQPALRRLAVTLARGSSSFHADPFWERSAANLLFVALSALSRVEDQRQRHVGNLRWILNHLSAGLDPDDPVHRFFCRYLDDAGFSEYRAFLAQDAKVIASVLSSARAALDLFADPDVVRLTASDSIRLEDLRQKPTAIYLITPEHLSAYYGLLFNLFCATAFEHCLERVDGLPVTFLLDEIGNLGKIEGFPTTITTLRKRRCSVALLLQSRSQLSGLYGPTDAQTIVAGGVSSRLFYGGLDLETCQYLEKVVGQRTTFDGSEEDGRPVGRPLLTADEIRMLRPDQAILVSGREPPARIRVRPFFASRVLLRLTQKPAVWPSVPASDETVQLLPLAHHDSRDRQVVPTSSP